MYYYTYFTAEKKEIKTLKAPIHNLTASKWWSWFEHKKFIPRSHAFCHWTIVFPISNFSPVWLPQHSSEGINTWGFNMLPTNLFHLSHFHCISQKHACELHRSELRTYTKKSLRGRCCTCILNFQTHYIFLELHSCVYYSSVVNSHSLKDSKLSFLGTIS